MRGDIISRLPDDVLSHIISRLEAKDAVKTSILSSTWKHLWTSIYNLHFEMRSCGRETLFVNFVEHVVRRCRSQNIQEFNLETSNYSLQDSDAARISKLMSSVVERNVRSLTLNFKVTAERPMVRLPQTILTCKSLVRLALGPWDTVVDIPESVVCFPSLKFLSITFDCPDANLSQKLFGSCPVLEELIIDGRHGKNENVLSFDITVPTLKKLKLDLTRSVHRYVIRAGNIEHLCVRNDFLACFVMEETPFLNKLTLDGEISSCLLYGLSNGEATNRAERFFKAISSTRCLSLSSDIMGVVIPALIGDLPLFRNLIRLNLGIEIVTHPELLFEFLNNSPNLEVLVLDKVAGDIYYYVEVVLFESECVPSCMLLHLTKIYFIGVERQDLKVVAYLLENSKVLERFSASIQGSKQDKQKIQSEILNFPRASPICEIEFLNSDYMDKFSLNLFED